MSDDPFAAGFLGEENNNTAQPAQAQATNEEIPPVIPPFKGGLDPDMPGDEQAAYDQEEQLPIPDETNDELPAVPVDAGLQVLPISAQADLAPIQANTAVRTVREVKVDLNNWNNNPSQYNGKARDTTNKTMIAQAPPTHSVSGVSADPGHPMQGGRHVWSDDLCDCYASLFVFCWSICFAPCRVAVTNSRAEIAGYYSSMVYYAVPWLMMLICFSMDLLTATAIGWGLTALIGGHYRAKLRKKFQIHVRDCCDDRDQDHDELVCCCCCCTDGFTVNDFLAHCLCLCCALSQEARHVDRIKGYVV